MKKDIHLLLTSRCNRNCKHCCNKQYNLYSIPYVTITELQNTKMVLFTGGEPVLYYDFNNYALFLKVKFKNIKKIVMYANALELYDAIIQGKNFSAIDGLSISIKNKNDRKAFETIIKEKRLPASCKSNRLYVFNNLNPRIKYRIKTFNREWQEHFKPAKNSIFRQVSLTRWI